jgi:hypothetical protein
VRLLEMTTESNPLNGRRGDPAADSFFWAQSRLRWGTTLHAAANATVFSDVDLCPDAC